MAGTANLGVIAGTANLGVIAGTANLGGIAGTANLGVIAGINITVRHIFNSLFKGELYASLDESSEGKFCTDLQFCSTELLVIIGLGISQCFDLCKVIERAVFSDQIVVIQHIERILTEVHSAVTDNCSFFLENGVLGILLATAYQTGGESFVTFHNFYSHFL